MARAEDRAKCWCKLPSPDVGYAANKPAQFSCKRVLA